jgi:hypothetical protein
MFNKKLKQKDLEILRYKYKMIREYEIIYTLLNQEKERYIKSILSNYKLDVNKSYRFDLKTGAIKEVTKTI